MDEEVLWTITFGLIGTIIGLVTIWQNSIVIQAKIELIKVQQQRRWWA
ncbi:uncharacterized protein AB675_7120 [Cyphellophora attinorum]|uniref:Uncharacterized protein n=1 Tax=Cyphellophora attinorum TaxID=1664694 RepID=A0A0N1HUR7_9EURO|nr:uncharacterized protein AB675_7120 [Phialophora attinorum]KPI43227.1 hypothetical protein AB675_7120 [Phialophora attinorum]